jgi:hypothetical protein
LVFVIAAKNSIPLTPLEMALVAPSFVALERKMLGEETVLPLVSRSSRGSFVQHEAIHHGKWSVYASLAGFDTPLSWRNVLGLVKSLRTPRRKLC